MMDYLVEIGERGSKNDDDKDKDVEGGWWGAEEDVDAEK